MTFISIKIGVSGVVYFTMNVLRFIILSPWYLIMGISKSMVFLGEVLTDGMYQIISWVRTPPSKPESISTLKPHTVSKFL